MRKNYGYLIQFQIFRNNPNPHQIIGTTRSQKNLTPKILTLKTWGVTNTQNKIIFTPLKYAQVAELVDALASGASDRKIVEVQVLFWAPLFILLNQ